MWRDSGSLCKTNRSGAQDGILKVVRTGGWPSVPVVGTVIKYRPRIRLLIGYAAVDVSEAPEPTSLSRWCGVTRISIEYMPGPGAGNSTLVEF